MKKLFLILSLLPFVSLAQLRQGEVDISGLDGQSIIQTKDNGYAIGGSAATGDYFSLTKLDSNGNIKWTSEVGGGNYNEAFSMIQTTDKGYVMTGYTQVYGAGGMDIYVVKLDSLGNLQWTKTIGGPDDDWGNSIIQTSDGGYAITGGTKSYGGGSPSLADIYVIKLDLSGNKIWTKTVEGPSGTNDEGYSIIESNDRGLVVTGSVAQGGGDDVYVFKMDSLGNMKWAEVIGGGSGYSIIQTFDKGYALTGWTGTYGAGIYDVYIIKLDSSGNLKWTRTIGGDSVDIGESIIQCKDKGFIIAGATNSFSSTEGIYVIKFDSNGNLKWSNIYQPTNSVGAYSITSTKDNGSAIIADGDSYIFLKLDSLGNSCMPHGSGGIIDSGDIITSGGIITSSDSGRIDAGGLVIRGGASENVICRVTSVPELVQDNDITIYPIPSRGNVTISLYGNNYKELSIYDVLGRNAYRKVLIPNEQDINLDVNLSFCTNGVYIVQVTKGEDIMTRKIILEK